MISITVKMNPSTNQLTGFIGNLLFKSCQTAC
jgi:hypothetical protein